VATTNKVSGVGLGNRATTRYLGEVGVGVVCHKCCAKQLLQEMDRGVDDPTFIQWNTLYPGWESKDIITLRYDKPQKTYSFADFCMYNNIEQNARSLAIYNKTVRRASEIAYPEEDVELF
jgi:hypothetical protein